MSVMTVCGHSLSVTSTWDTIRVCSELYMWTQLICGNSFCGYVLLWDMFCCGDLST